MAGGGARGLVIDLTDFEYRFGNWIGAVPLWALRTLGMGRVCLLASGETAAALRSLWEPTQLDRLVPLFGDLRESLGYLSGAEMGPRGVELGYPSQQPHLAGRGTRDPSTHPDAGYSPQFTETTPR